MEGHIEERARKYGTSYRLRLHIGGSKYITETMPKGTTRRQAEARLSALLDQRLGRHSDLRVSDLWQRYEQYGLPRLSPSTRAGYRKIWRLRIEPHLANVKVRRLTVANVEDWLSDLHVEGLSWNTVRHARGLLGAMLTFAARRGEGAVTLPHVAKRAELPGEEPVGHITVPEPAQVAAVLQELIETDLELATFERIAAVTGARRGEIAALRLEDVTASGLVFDEAVRVEVIDGKGVLSVGPTKTKQRRLVSVDDETMMLVDAWALHAGIEQPRALLFAAQDGGPYHPERWSHRWRRACARHGVTTHQHALRHLVGTLTAETLGLRAAQERLGHARSSTTERYAHVRSAQSGQAADLMAAALRAEE
jgi:integrase